jgi:hypothetical protein
MASIFFARATLMAIPSVKDFWAKLVVTGIALATIAVAFGESFLLLGTFGGASIVFPLVLAFVLLVIVAPIPAVAGRLEKLGPVRVVACGLGVTVMLLMLALAYLAAANFAGFEIPVRIHGF